MASPPAGRLVQPATPTRIPGHDRSRGVRNRPLRGPRPRAATRMRAAQNLGRFNSRLTVSRTSRTPVLWIRACDRFPQQPHHGPAPSPTLNVDRREQCTLEHQKGTRRERQGVAPRRRCECVVHVGPPLDSGKSIRLFVGTDTRAGHRECVGWSSTVHAAATPDPALSLTSSAPPPNQQNPCLTRVAVLAPQTAIEAVPGSPKPPLIRTSTVGLTGFEPATP
jgi:hypothetical protein